MLARELCTILHFTSEELKANREGYLTKSQRIKLRAEGRGTAILIGLAYGAVSAIPLILFYLIYAQGFSPNHYTAHENDGIAGVLAVALFIVVFLGGIFRARSVYQRYEADLYKGKVHAAVGHVYLFIRYRGRRWVQYYLIVHNEMFIVPEYLFESFNERGFYGLYFVPYSRTILSAEKLPEI